MAQYVIEFYEGSKASVTHEINVDWSADEPVLTSPTALVTEPDDLWRIVETRYRPERAGTGQPCISYLVRRP